MDDAAGEGQADAGADAGREKSTTLLTAVALGLMLSTCPEMVRFGMASNVIDAVWFGASLASVSAKGMTAIRLLLSSITMKALNPEPEAVPDAACGARELGDCAVAPDAPPATPSPGTPWMLTITPDVGAVSVVSSTVSWTART